MSKLLREKKLLDNPSDESSLQVSNPSPVTSADTTLPHPLIEKAKRSTLLKKLSFYGILGGLLLFLHQGWLEQIINVLFGVESGPLIGLLKTETRGFIILFLVSLYLDLFKKEDFGKAIASIFVEIEATKGRLSQLQRDTTNIQHLLDKEYWSKLKPEHVVERILKICYGETTPVKNLLSIVLPNKPHYMDAVVEVTISDCEDNSEFCVFQYEMRFAAALKEFVLAFVNSTVLQDRVSTFCPAVNEVFTFYDDASREEYIANVLRGDHSFRIVRTSATGLTSEEKMRFIQVDEAKLKDYLCELSTSSQERITLLNCPLPKTYSNLVISFSYKARKDTHFYYWVADRPIYIRHFKIDATRLSLIDNNRIAFHPLFANTTTCKDSDPRPGIFSANVNNWIVKGQGVAVSWGPICRK